MTSPRRLSILFAALLLAGCVSGVLRLQPASPVDSMVPGNRPKDVKALMVLPPRGSDRGEVSELAGIEKALLAKGFRVISSGVTGRVVSEPEGNKGIAANLSDLERALILAKDSNADALLQIEEAGWRSAYRPFLYANSEFREVSPGSDVKPSDTLIRIRESVFKLSGRLIDVETGDILMVVAVSQSTSRAIAQPKSVEVSLEARGTTNVSMDSEDLRDIAIAQAAARFVAHVATWTPAVVRDPSRAGQ